MKILLNLYSWILFADFADVFNNTIP